ncbi:MAG: ABC transporter permease [Sphingobium sp.]
MSDAAAPEQDALAQGSGHGAILRIIAGRLAVGVGIVGGISLLTFLLARVLPGNPAYLIAGQYADEATIRAVEHQFGLDQPLWHQYLGYAGALLRGDFSTSFTTGRPVLIDIAERFPATVELTLFGFGMAALIAFALGIGAAARPRGIIDRTADLVASLGAALPGFWLGLILIYLFFYRMRLFPAPLGRYPDGNLPYDGTGFLFIDTLAAGDGTAFLRACWSLFLPALTLAFHAQPPLLRLVRSQMRRALDSAPVRTARATGLSARRILLGDALRLALVPVLHMMVLTLGGMLSGAVLVETVFAWPGIGQYAVQAIQTSDYPAIQGVILIASATYALLYMAVDVAEVLIDPRLQQP